MKLYLLKLIYNNCFNNKFEFYLINAQWAFVDVTLSTDLGRSLLCHIVPGRPFSYIFVEEKKGIL